jgi:hypothetical protein
MPLPGVAVHLLDVCIGGLYHWQRQTTHAFRGLQQRVQALPGNCCCRVIWVGIGAGLSQSGVGCAVAVTVGALSPPAQALTRHITSNCTDPVQLLLTKLVRLLAWAGELAVLLQALPTSACRYVCNLGFNSQTASHCCCCWCKPSAAFCLFVQQTWSPRLVCYCSSFMFVSACDMKRNLAGRTMVCCCEGVLHKLVCKP